MSSTLFCVLSLSVLASLSSHLVEADAKVQGPPIQTDTLQSPQLHSVSRQLAETPEGDLYTSTGASPQGSERDTPLINDAVLSPAIVPTTVKAKDPILHRLLTAHGWCMYVSWGGLIPAAVVISRSFKSGKSSVWFHAHRMMSSIGFAVALAGVFCALPLHINRKLKSDHRAIGITVTAVAGVQVLVALFVRPSQTSQYRRVFNLLHTYLGNASLVLAVADIFIGMHLTHHHSRSFLLQAAVLCTLALASMLWDSVQYLRQPLPAFTAAPPDKEHLQLCGLGDLQVANSMPEERGSLIEDSCGQKAVEV
ncbi:hypothetical protein WJX72_007206 [[Myrmecia] bisecta]|uniref:Cytochrome b561 domain-containing protein n=1 Tax=[Myrmecia] bisecta TaxID=41462 RepID=A0AAW1PCU3_9CHLO